METRQKVERQTEKIQAMSGNKSRGRHVAIRRIIVSLGSSPPYRRQVCRRSCHLQRRKGPTM